MRSIIVGTDFSNGSFVALEIAVDIARALQTNITLIWVQQERILASDEDRETMRKLSMEKLDELCKQYSEKLPAQLTIIPKVARGKVPTVLADEAKKANAPMIVIGTNGASGFEKYWMGSTAVRIVQEAPCPTLSIREGFNFHKALEHIIVPIRFTTSSREKLRPAAAMAKIFKSKIHLLGLLDAPSVESQLRSYMQQSANYLTQEGIPHNSVIKKSDNACDTILEYADEIKADLIIIHTEQDKFLSSLFMGTNAQQIVHKSQIPVMSIHPEDYASVSR